MPTFLITGAKGQLGQELQHLAAALPQVRLICTDRDELDISDAAAIGQFFAAHDVDALINCAAYTAVDKAESDSALAARINAEAPGLLAAACRERGCPFLHVSTDYVYHNSLNRPLREDDPTEPKGVYAATKLAGEQAALAAHPDGTLVLRTSWVYSAFAHNFLKTMLRFGPERGHLRVVYDQVGTPTYAQDLAAALLHIGQALLSGEGGPWAGVYNYSNEGVTSWYDFALAIFAAEGIACRVDPIVSAEYPTPAQRPSYSVLDKAKVKARFGLAIPHWADGLRRCLAALHA